MKILSMLRRAVALGVLSASIAVLSGCGGSHGGGSSASPADKVAAAFKGGNFAGSFDANNEFRSRGTTPTGSSIQFDTNGGVVSFASGTSGTSTFRTFSANITNIVYVNSTSTPTGASGTINFDLVNFTANDFITGTAHFTASYTVAASNFQLLTTGGKLTGTSPTGAAISLGFNLNYQPLIAKVDLSGNYTGTIDLPGLTGSTSTPWTGSLTVVDDLHLKASIVTSSSTISFTGQNTHETFASAFDGSQISPLATGAFAQFYVQSTDGGATLTGAYILVDATGAIFPNPLTGQPVFGTITAKKVTSGGGGGTTTAALKAGYYDGGIKNASGALDGRILKLNITKVSATTGANGGMVIVTGGNSFNIGGRVASVTGSGSTATVTIDNISNTYSKIVLTGPVSGTSFNATYTATKLDGTTETGSLDQFGQGSTTTTSLTGSWKGTAAGGTGSSSFAATFKSNGDGTVLITPTSKVGGDGSVTNPGYSLPAFTSYQAGSSFAGHVNGTTGSSPLIVQVVGDFDGDVSGNKISGDYIYEVTFVGGTTPLTEDSGTLSLTKS